MESSAAETRDQLARDQVGANVVHVAAAKVPFRVDSTSQLFHASPDSVGSCPSDNDNVPGSPTTLNTTTTLIANCGTANTFGCCLPNPSVVDLPAITPHRPNLTGVCYSEAKMNSNSRTPAVNHDVSSRPVTNASPGGGGDTIVDDMATFRAALEAADPSTLVGLRRARSKSVLVPVYRPPPLAAVRFRSRGSVQMTPRDDDVDLDENTEPYHHQRLYQQQPQTAKAVQTSVSYSRERFRSASLATRGSRRSRDSTSMSEMCLEYMRLNGMVPRYPSLQQQHDDGLIRSSSCVVYLFCFHRQERFYGGYLWCSD